MSRLEPATTAVASSPGSGRSWSTRRPTRSPSSPTKRDRSRRRCQNGRRPSPRSPIPSGVPFAAAALISDRRPARRSGRASLARPEPRAVGGPARRHARPSDGPALEHDRRPRGRMVVGLRRRRRPRRGIRADRARRPPARAGQGRRGGSRDRAHRRGRVSCCERRTRPAAATTLLVALGSIATLEQGLVVMAGVVVLVGVGEILRMVRRTRVAPGERTAPPSSNLGRRLERG